MSIKCGDISYDGDETHRWHCTEYAECDIPENERKGPCICAFGYKNLTDGTCMLACPNTPHNGDPAVCLSMSHCEKPANGDNCTCASGYIMNRYGECETHCLNTTYTGGNECTRKVGCKNPDNNVRG